MPGTAAAAKSLQSCPFLCDPIDGSPPGHPVPRILQARTLEWVASSFSNAWKWKVKVKSLSRVWLLVTPWTAAHQAPPSMGFFQAGVPERGAIAFSDARHYCKSNITYTHTLINTHLILKPQEVVLFLPLFDTWGNWAIERLLPQLITVGKCWNQDCKNTSGSKVCTLTHKRISDVRKI